LSDTKPAGAYVNPPIKVYDPEGKKLLGKRQGKMKGARDDIGAREIDLCMEELKSEEKTRPTPRHVRQGRGGWQRKGEKKKNIFETRKRKDFG